jgi:thiamine biosynthesis lipoprotein
MIDSKFRAMGTDCHIKLRIASDQDKLVDSSERLVRRFETIWSRFLPDSEVSKINQNAGNPVKVSKETFKLIEESVKAWKLSGRLFNPLLGKVMIQAGYDRDFKLLPELVESSPVVYDPDSPKLIELDSENVTVKIPSGSALDLGGIAKGKTADLLASSLQEAGVLGGLVNIGGDIRVWSDSNENSWVINCVCPGSDKEIRVALINGAVCTSSVTKRSWVTKTRTEVHIRDGFSGRSAQGELVSGTAISSRAAQGEVLAKILVLSGLEKGAELLGGFGATGVAVAADGIVNRLPGFERFEIR